MILLRVKISEDIGVRVVKEVYGLVVSVESFLKMLFKLIHRLCSLGGVLLAHKISQYFVLSLFLLLGQLITIGSCSLPPVF